MSARAARAKVAREEGIWGRLGPTSKPCKSGDSAATRKSCRRWNILLGRDFENNLTILSFGLRLRLVVADGGKLSLVVELVEESRYDKTIVKVVLSILNKPFKGIFIKCLVED